MTPSLFYTNYLYSLQIQLPQYHRNTQQILILSDLFLDPNPMNYLKLGDTNYPGF